MFYTSRAWNDAKFMPYQIKAIKILRNFTFQAVNVAKQVVRFLLPAFSVPLIIWVFIDVRVFIDVMNYAPKFSIYVTRVNEFAI